MNRPPTVIMLLALLAGCATTVEVPVATETDAPLRGELQGEERIRFLLEYGELLLEQRRLAEAERVIEDLRLEVPDSSAALRMLARLHEARARPGLALLAREQVYRRNPEAMEDAAEYARVALLNGRYVTADTIYQGWLEGAPPGSRAALAALNNLGYSQLLQKRPGEARHYLTQALALDPLNRRARANLILAYRLEGREAEAQEQVDLLGFDPGEPAW